MNRGRESTPLIDLIEASDPNIHPADSDRLRGQNLLVLQRLRLGPATNADLAKISLKYTSRISDVRKWLAKYHQTIECDRGEGGLNVYRIARIK